MIQIFIYNRCHEFITEVRFVQRTEYKPSSLTVYHQIHIINRSRLNGSDDESRTRSGNVRTSQFLHFTTPWQCSKCDADTLIMRFWGAWRRHRAICDSGRVCWMENYSVTVIDWNGFQFLNLQFLWVWKNLWRGRGLNIKRYFEE